MNPLDFEVWSEYYPDKYTPEGLLKLLTPEARLQIVEYHYNYLRMRDRYLALKKELAAANGKIYALQETIDGRG